MIYIYIYIYTIQYTDRHSEIHGCWWIRMTSKSSVKSQNFWLKSPFFFAGEKSGNIPIRCGNSCFFLAGLIWLVKHP